MIGEVILSDRVMLREELRLWNEAIARPCLHQRADLPVKVARRPVQGSRPALLHESKPARSSSRPINLDLGSAQVLALQAEAHGRERRRLVGPRSLDYLDRVIEAGRRRAARIKRTCSRREPGGRRSPRFDAAASQTRASTSAPSRSREPSSVVARLASATHEEPNARSRPR